MPSMFWRPKNGSATADTVIALRQRFGLDADGIEANLLHAHIVS
jgi:hypothetical protein